MGMFSDLVEDGRDAAAGKGGAADFWQAQIAVTGGASRTGASTTS
jgi:hypothetical protein